jgi:hypothetical protein
MPITMSCETDRDWNQNRLTIVDGVRRVTVSVHDEDDNPTDGKTVSIRRQEFLELCEAYTRLTPPTDRI